MHIFILELQASTCMLLPSEPPELPHITFQFQCVNTQLIVHWRFFFFHKLTYPREQPATLITVKASHEGNLVKLLVLVQLLHWLDEEVPIHGDKKSHRLVLEIGVIKTNSELQFVDWWWITCQQNKSDL